MAMNIGQMRNALTGSSIPAGWNYDAMNSCYKGPDGEIITEMDILKHGSFYDALREYKIQQSYELAKQSMAANVTSVGSTEKMRIDNNGNGWLGQGLGVSIKPASTLEIKGKLGNIKIDLDTGELTLPPNVGRDAGIRDFWLGFQEHFQSTNKAEYEKKIADLRHDVQALKDRAIQAEVSSLKDASKKVAAKVAAKYSGEKFIMVKPEDLIKFIESE